MKAMPRLSYCTKFSFTAIIAIIIFGLYANFNTTSFCPTQPVVVAKYGGSKGFRIEEAQNVNLEKDVEDDNYQEYKDRLNSEAESLLPHHPFDNLCRFPLAATYPKDLSDFRVGERLRQLKCKIDHYPLASTDSEGYLYIHNHFEHYGNITKGVNCEIIIIEGALRDPKTNKGKDVIKEVKTIPGIENKRLWVNADAYIVRCKKNKAIVWEKPFPGMRDITKEKNTVAEAKDIEEFDDFGRKLKMKPRKTPDRYSIDILGFDSTARSMFFRHLPRTVDTMNKLGYHFFYGYNKIGDNSLINLGPILAGDLPEVAKQNKTDISGDINADWIMPENEKLDPTAIPFLWKMMKEKFGCRSMLNEDISKKIFGLFHYPYYGFLPGFTEMPADHFYRAYYLAVYANWKYGPCKDGDQIQKEFVDLWYRFAHKYKDICHFGFTFVTTLTHEVGLTLETLDEYLAGRLAQLHLSGASDNSLSIIMGDHGNRIGPQQYSYSGRIEERMPLMAIRLPNNFAKTYPIEYGHFIKNKYKLVSNFDVHQMLKDIVLMRLGKSDVRREGRGISLFTEIPRNRTCQEAYIAYNFCTCLIDQSNVAKPYKNRESKSKEERTKNSFEAIKTWLKGTELSECVRVESVKIEGSIQTFGINPFVRHGFRTLTNLKNNAMLKDAEAKADYFYHEVTVSATTVVEEKLSLLFRIEEETQDGVYKVIFEPFVKPVLKICHRPSLTETCACLFEEKRKSKVIQ